MIHWISHLLNWINSEKGWYSVCKVGWSKREYMVAFRKSLLKWDRHEFPEWILYPSPTRWNTSQITLWKFHKGGFTWRIRCSIYVSESSTIQLSLVFLSSNRRRHKNLNPNFFCYYSLCIMFVGRLECTNRFLWTLKYQYKRKPVKEDKTVIVALRDASIHRLTHAYANRRLERVSHFFTREYNSIM